MFTHSQVARGGRISVYGGCIDMIKAVFFDWMGLIYLTQVGLFHCALAIRSRSPVTFQTFIDPLRHNAFTYYI